MVDGNRLIEKLLIYATGNLYLNEADVIYKRNRLLTEFKLIYPYDGVISEDEKELIVGLQVPDVLFDEAMEYAKENFGYDENDSERFACNVFSIISPLPSVIIQSFKRFRELRGARSACEYLYNISVKNNYVRKTAVSKNELWAFEGEYDINLAINMSKPEKDNKEVALLAKTDTPQNNYPKCLLCRSNQGFWGNSYTPPRANLVLTTLELAKESWFLQYSPFAYLNEHCIVINEKHTPMSLQPIMIDRMFDFIEYIPDYFIGSNCDLPIIGGSIPVHEHYQGGRCEMSLFKAKSLIEFHSQEFPDVEISLIDWPIADIRLSGYNRNTIKELFAVIIEKWKSYTDDAVPIINSKEERHNSASVSARFSADAKYSVDIIFRNNATSEACPHGIYHVPEKYQNIKKEALGIMEVLGLFILPSRLKREFSEIIELLTDKARIKSNDYGDTETFATHKTMIDELVEKYGSFKDAQKAENAIRDYVGKAAIDMLKNASIFKHDDDGILTLRKFLASMNIK